MTQKETHIIVVGGNYAGLNTMQYLFRTLLHSSAKASAPETVRITLIDQRTGFLHYIGITRGLTNTRYGETLWVPYSSIPWLRHPMITVVHGSVSEITHNKVIVDGDRELCFDYLVMAMGLGRPSPIGGCARTQEDYVKEITEACDYITRAQSVVVVGGGAVGIEMAADVKCEYPEKTVTLVHSHRLPLPGPFTDEFRHSIVDILANKMGITLCLGHRVIIGAEEPIGNDLTLSNSTKITADCVIPCLGTTNRHQIINLGAGTCTPGGVRVLSTMQLPEHPHIFAIGDLAAYSEVKLAGPAMHNGYVAARNIARMVLRGHANAKLEESPRFPAKILLLMGKHQWAMQMDKEIWDSEKVRQFVYDDMGLGVCIKALALDHVPEFEPLD
ncbi:hypothetical protein BX070DRAFT_250296 [Coemansia spiralis]|nr:hypothetical protein BX070DRAFT_250296 [Coemansia spiralis]